MPSNRLPHTQALLADSLVVGTLSMLMGLGAVACILAGLGEPGLSWKDQLGFFFTFCTPPLALLNMYFSYRDEKRGLRRQARAGLALSFLAIFVSITPLLFAD